MNGLRLWLVSLAFATTTGALAQQGNLPVRANVQELGRIAAEQDKSYRIKRAEAIALAKKNNWVIEKTYSDGRHVSLQGLDELGMPIYYITDNNSAAAATTRTNQLWQGGALGLNLSGSGSHVSGRMGVWDGGMVRESHVELRGRVEQKDGAKTLSDHATHVAGTMIASGQNAYARGMAYGLQKLHAYDFNESGTEMAEAAKNNMLVSNHSYGSIAGWRLNPERKGTNDDPYWEWWGNPQISETEDYRFGYYDETSALWDRIAYNAPYFLIVKSGGNNRRENGPAVGQPYMQRNASGNFTLVPNRSDRISRNDSYDAISTYGNAKNILTVGAVAALTSGYNQASDVKVTDFSSFGPTDDGRIKPDIMGNGQKVLSSVSSSDRSYRALDGTSMSAPNVSGSLLLLQEYYANLNSGRFMRAATLKGLAIHSADEAGDAPGPDYRHGWGLMNTGRAAEMITNNQNGYLIEERSLAQGGTYSFEVVASGKGPLAVTISWTDPEGSVLPATSALNNRSPRLVNDLDLRISGVGKTHLPWILDPNNPDAPATHGDNIRDNVEQVLIPNPTPGETYTITVSHKGTLQQGPQAYSLLASGVGGTKYCASAASSDAGSRITKTIIDGVTKSWDGCATYRGLQETRINFERGQIKTLSFELGSCGASASKVSKVYVDWNGNGSFDDPGETVATSSVVAGTGMFQASITAPTTLPIDFSTRMRVVMVETTNPADVTPCGSYTRGETQDYTIYVIRPTVDLEAKAVQAVGGSLCSGGKQQFMVTIQNRGTTPQSNIPVSLRITRNGSEIAVLSQVYANSLAPFAQAEVLLSADFATDAGSAYTLEATVVHPSDAIPDNNSAQQTVAVGTPPAAPQAVATRCGDQPSYTLTGSGAGTIFWYTSPTGGTAVAAGNTASVTIASAGSTLYASLNDFSGTIGPATKNFAAGGGYNQFTPSVIVDTRAPMLLETARLYIGHSGKITFTAYNSDGAPVSSRTIPVTATRTVPGLGVQVDDPQDKGAVHYIGLELPEAGTYQIAIDYEDGATIYRNNDGVTGYPFGFNNVFTITGNTANPGPLTYYYYFYDLKVRALGCTSPRVAVPVETGTPIPTPTVTRQGLNLRSSTPNGNQWLLNGQPILGATRQTYTPTESGDYSVRAEWMGCVSTVSESYTFAFQANGRQLKKELVASPNPSNGVFKVQLETDKRVNIHLRVTDMLGHEIYSRQVKSFNGFYEGEIDLSAKNSGIYLLRAEFGDQYYTQKLVLQR